MKQNLMELKGEIAKSKMIFGAFNTPLTASDRITRGKINKDRRDPNNIVN